MSRSDAAGAHDARLEACRSPAQAGGHHAAQRHPRVGVQVLDASEPAFAARQPSRGLLENLHRRLLVAAARELPPQLPQHLHQGSLDTRIEQRTLLVDQISSPAPRRLLPARPPLACAHAPGVHSAPRFCCVRFHPLPPFIEAWRASAERACTCDPLGRKDVVMVFSKSNGAWLAAASITCVASLGAQAQPARPAVAEPVLAAVDVVVTQEVFDADGSAPVPVQSRTAFTLQKVRTAGGSTRVTLTYRATQASGPGARLIEPARRRARGVQTRPPRPRRFSIKAACGSIPGSPRAAAGRFPWVSPTGLARGAGVQEVRRDSAPSRSWSEASGAPLAGPAGSLDMCRPATELPRRCSLTRSGCARRTDRHPAGRAGRAPQFEYASTPSGNLFRRASAPSRLSTATGRRSVRRNRSSPNVRAAGW